MLYAKIQNDQVVQIASLKSLLPNVSLPANPDIDFLLENNILPVAEKPVFDAVTQKLKSEKPTIVGNQVVTSVVVGLTSEEITNMQNKKASEIRYERDKLLAKSDWTQVGDNPMSAKDKTAWTTYRQALRDVTEQDTFPNSVTWPKAPNYVEPIDPAKAAPKA